MTVGFNKTSVIQIEIPDSIPEDLPFVLDDCSLAFSLGVRNKTLWWLLLHKADQYNKFKIPKTTGGFRVLHAPKEHLKYVQENALVNYLAPLQDKLGPHVTAYRKQLSTSKAVLQHIPLCPICDAQEATPKKHECPRKGLYIHIDIKDFFPTTNQAWIRNYFKNQGYNHNVAGLLSNIMTVRDFPNLRYDSHNPRSQKILSGVPQGAPTSGAICNLIADWRLDQPILEYLQQRNTQDGLENERRWVYTRYSDDLSFTCGRMFTRDQTQSILTDLQQLVHRAGYRVNKKKTRIAFGYHGRYLLGTVFNQKPNIREIEYKQIRALLHNCLVEGVDTQLQRAGKQTPAELIDYLKGKVNYIGQISQSKGERLRSILTAILQQNSK